MKSLRFFLVLLLVWLGTQIVIWSWSEFILKGSQLERMLELEDVEPYLKIPFYLLWPLTVAVPVTRRIVKKDNTSLTPQLRHSRIHACHLRSMKPERHHPLQVSYLFFRHFD